jgi:hypothetical protein
VSTLKELEQSLGTRPGVRTRYEKRPPAVVFELTPDHFAEDFDGRPVAPIEIGLRVPSEAEARTIEDAAARESAADETDSEAAYNRATQSYWVARAICDPRDVTSAHPFFDMPEDLVPVAFKPGTIVRICQEVAKLGVEQSPLHPEADDEEVGELSDLLAVEEPFAAVKLDQERLVRRYLKFALEILRDE